MIDINDVLDEIGAQTALWCDADTDDVDLAAAVAAVVEQNMGWVSVASNAVARVWPWLEKTRVKIATRLRLKSDSVADISELATQINAAFKQGADDIQLFVRVTDLHSLVVNLLPIRDDLFFNKSLTVVLDIGDIDDAMWGAVFADVAKIRADALMLELTYDAGDASDFVGRVYGALRHWNTATQNFGLHFAPCDDFMRIEQAYRLVQKMQPKLLPRSRFFMKY